MTLYHTVLSGIDIIALLILNGIIRQSDVAAARVRRFFRLSITAVIAAVLAEVTTLYCESAGAAYRGLHILGNAVGFGVSPLVPLLIGSAISRGRRKGEVLFWIPFAVNLLLSVLSAWVPAIFAVGPDSSYVRGPLFWVYPAAYAAGLVDLFFKTLAAARRYQSTNRSVLLVLYLFVGFGTSIQLLLPQLPASWFCISLSICLYYTYYCELYHQIDGLTELLNRRAYERCLAGIDKTHSAAIFFFDIDDFKLVNDRHGHLFGDVCLSSVAACIKGVFAGTGLCFRIGGDEFCVIARAKAPDRMEELYAKFLQDIEALRAGEPRLPMVSVGFVFYDCRAGSVEQAVFAADQRMYAFKNQRKKRGPVLP